MEKPVSVDDFQHAQICVSYFKQVFSKNKTIVRWKSQSCVQQNSVSVGHKQTLWPSVQINNGRQILYNTHTRAQRVRTKFYYKNKFLHGTGSAHKELFLE